VRLCVIVVHHLKTSVTVDTPREVDWSSSSLESVLRVVYRRVAFFKRGLEAVATPRATLLQNFFGVYN